MAKPAPSDAAPEPDALTLALDAAALAVEGDGPALRAAAVSVLRQVLDEGRAAARTRLEAGGDGVEVAWELSALADRIVVGLWDLAWRHHLKNANPTAGERVTLLAVGGYGRGVLAPYSDLDLLFLRPGKETASSESLIEFMLYALWDLGFKVGSASRTIAETLRIAREDMTVRTAVLEARFLAGETSLAADLRKRFEKEIVKGTAREFIAAKMDERDARHAKLGASRYLVEPNVKEGKGGLRDLHALFWIAQYLDPTSPRGEKLLENYVTAKDRRTFTQAFSFLWAVRAHLHFITGRAEERMSFDVQPEIARRMGWKDRADELAVERFMRRYFLFAKDVGVLTRIFCAKLEADGTKKPEGLSRFLPVGRPKRRKLADDPGFAVEDGRLTVDEPGLFEKDPVALLRLFRAADRERLDLHPDAFTAVIRSLHLVTAHLRRDPKAARVFLDILAYGQRPYRTLSLMNEAGLLGKFLPEFGRVVGQTQLNRYHAYTVDEHTLRAIGIINDVEKGLLNDDHPLAHSILPMIVDREALYLAMLLHDTGKGGQRGQEEDGAIAARRACDRLGLPRAQADLTAWLVMNHLVLSDYAQKRDVSDADTVAAFARIVESPERLRLLLVLTVADIRAVGPGVWNGWKGQLMRELFTATEAVLRGSWGADPASTFRKRAEAAAVVARETLVSTAPGSAAFAEAMDDDYFSTVTLEEQTRHAELAAAAGLEGAAANARFRADRNATEISIAAADRQGLFADLAQCLADQGADVIGARVFTSGGGVALDVFYLQDASGAPFGQHHAVALKRACRELEQAALGKRAPREPRREPAARSASFMITPSVAIDNEATETATIVEISGRDRQGLLAALARTLSQAGLSIQSAHVDNYGARAVDAFYVHVENGGKLLEPERLEALKSALLEVFGPHGQAAAAARPAA